MLKIEAGGLSAVSFAVIFIGLSAQGSAIAQDDDCEDAGKLGVMLGQIDQQCDAYELTDMGRKVMLKMAEKVLPLGGERCAEIGKVAMLQQMATLFPNLTVAAASGDSTRFNAELCGSISKYLSMTGRAGAQLTRGRR